MCRIHYPQTSGAVDVGASKVEKVAIGRKNGSSLLTKHAAIVCMAYLFCTGCASTLMSYEHEDHLKKIDEFDQQVKVEAITPPATVPAAGTPANVAEAKAAASEKSKNKKSKKSKKSAKTEVAAEPVSTQHEPADVEGTVGFVGRRPLKDPFWVGERMLHNVSWFGVDAGRMELKMSPFIHVNGRKSYQFDMHAWSSPFFSKLHRIDDQATNLIDFDSLVPTAFTVHQKEPKQLKESRAYFDRTKLTASYWERRVTPDNPEEEKKIQWEIPDYSQNVFSAAYYLRVFTWKLNDEHAFRVADDGQNLIFKATAVRKETITTPAGEFKAIVIKPEMQLRGAAKPMGDIFVWISDDDRKFILRIESKIKIGTLVSELIELDPGVDPEAK